MKHQDESQPGINCKLSKLNGNDSQKIKESGIISPDLSKLKAIKINSKTVIYR